ncbi:MAG TPA: hypothetical protein VJ372_04490 [Pyrinomonadaceae bacterium]|jgi:hypothetical protein|nr:hypothetical protein [Pyrinomonadaceae bacterium]
MNYLRIPLVFLLTVALTGVVSVSIATAQGTSALERGYRTGYSDGYSAGVGDAGNQAARDYQNKEEYQLGNRSFNDAWGTIEDYRDGYQQGFESGYAAGYDHQQFDSNLPTGLKRRGTAPNGARTTPVNGAGTTPVSTAPNGGSTTAVTASQDTTGAPDNSDKTAVQTSGSLNIPRNTILSLELMTPLSTEATQRNDPFKAQVTEPKEFANYIVEGRVLDVKRPGKAKGVAQLQLSFDHIRSPDNRVADLHAVLLEVVPLNSDSSPNVDSEGAIRGRDSTKDDVAKVGGASGIGAIIGVIAGGGKGAAIGSIIGAGAGTAGVMTQRGRELRLEQGQQMKIRTSSDTGGQ